MSSKKLPADTPVKKFGLTPDQLNKLTSPAQDLTIRDLKSLKDVFGKEVRMEGDGGTTACCCCCCPG